MEREAEAAKVTSGVQAESLTFETKAAVGSGGVEAGM